MTRNPHREQLAGRNGNRDYVKTRYDSLRPAHQGHPRTQQKKIRTRVHVPHVYISKLRFALVNVKDPLLLSKCWGVVYKIPCSECKCVQIARAICTDV